MPIYIENLTTEVIVRDPRDPDEVHDLRRLSDQISLVLDRRAQRDALRQAATRLLPSCRRAVQEGDSCR